MRAFLLFISAQLLFLFEFARNLGGNLPGACPG
jgi:hypothetical protein